MSAEGTLGLGNRISLGVVKARRIFFKMSMREKALLLLFVLAIVAVWFTWLLDRQRATQAEIRAARSAAEIQELTMSYEPTVRQQYDELISRIDLASLPSKYEVTGQIDALVRRFGFSDFDLGEPRTEEGAGLNFHTIQLVVQQATYPQIKKFTETIKAELPFVSLERIVIQAQTRNDEFLDVRYVFKSIEHTQ